MRVMRRHRVCTVRELKQATNATRIGVGDWDKALKALCSAGEMRVTEEPGGHGNVRRVVILLKDVE